MSLDVAEVYATYHAAVCAYFRRRLGDDWEMAEDLAADVFARVWAKRETYHERDGVPIHKWLYRIAHNRLVDYWRIRRPTTVLVDGYGGRASYTLRWDELDRHLEIDDAIATLPAKQRMVIVGRYYEDRMHQDLGHISSANGTKKLQDRALANLRKALEAA